jgi:prepilin-type N-terminal cleavage/methylation domain-containing protein
MAEVTPTGRRVRPGRGRGVRPGADDAGFTLLEVLVSMGVVVVVSAFALLFHVSSMSTVRGESNRQVAAQLVAEALDEAQATGGAALATATPQPVGTTVNDVTFTRTWSVEVCRQITPGGACTVAAPAAGVAELVRVVVAVSWQESGAERTERSAVLLAAAQSRPGVAS